MKNGIPEKVLAFREPDGNVNVTYPQDLMYGQFECPKSPFKVIVVDEEFNRTVPIGHRLKLFEIGTFTPSETPKEYCDRMAKKTLAAHPSWKFLGAFDQAEVKKDRYLSHLIKDQK